MIIFSIKPIDVGYHFRKHPFHPIGNPKFQCLQYLVLHQRMAAGCASVRTQHRSHPSWRFRCCVNVKEDNQHSKDRSPLKGSGYMGVSKNRGTPKSSHFNRVFHGFPIINHPFSGSPIFETSIWSNGIIFHQPSFCLK